MIDYPRFTVEDFATDPAFRRWATGHAPEADAFWTYWQEVHPEKAATVAQARLLVLALTNTTSAITDDEIQLVVSNITDLARRSADKPWGWQLSFRPLRSGWRVAAVLTLLVGIGWIGWQQRDVSSPTPVQANRATRPAMAQPETIEVSNQTTADYVATLPDGSTVRLKRGSRLTFPKTFAANQREVTLRGEGFFEVVRRPDQPFLVYANQLVTKVLGTSFTVKAYDQDQQVMVSVRTGRVMVFPQANLSKPTAGNSVTESRQQLLLTPNQQAIFRRQVGELTKALVAQPLVLLPTAETPDFRFDNAPIAQVFGTLERAYGVNISYDTDLLQHCTVTAPLGDEPLFAKLDLICKIIGAHYEIVDAQVVVSGPGCSTPPPQSPK